MECGEEVPSSFGKYLLKRQKKLELSDNATAYLAGSVFGVGSDTTASAISIILAAACYPNEQLKVREELENVLGRERVPTLADQERLPRTMAWVLETFRWRPVDFLIERLKISHGCILKLDNSLEGPYFDGTWLIRMDMWFLKAQLLRKFVYIEYTECNVHITSSIQSLMTTQFMPVLPVTPLALLPAISHTFTPRTRQFCISITLFFRTTIHLATFQMLMCRTKKSIPL